MRGLRQCDDPLLSYLFIIIEEVLSRMLKVDFENGRIGKCVHPRGCPLISHLLYADDLLVFTNGKHRSLKQLLTTLGVYEQWSRWKINNANSTIFFSSKFNSGRSKGLIKLIGFTEGCFPFIYLRVLVTPRRLTGCILDPLIQKIWNKVAS